MRIIDARAKEQIQNSGKRGIADVPILPGHGSWRDAPLKSGSHAQACTVDQTADHRDAIGEIVAAVGISHKQIPAEGAAAAPDQGRAITSLRYIDHSRTKLICQRLAAVVGAVVGDHDLAGKAVGGFYPRKRLPRIRDAVGQALLFIEAGHDDRDVGHTGSAVYCVPTEDRLRLHALSSPRRESCAAQAKEKWLPKSERLGLHEDRTLPLNMIC